MRNFTGNYSIVPSCGGEVICYERGNRKEYLGSDGLWHRTPQHCDSFTQEGHAAARVTRLQEEDEQR